MPPKPLRGVQAGGLRSGKGWICTSRRGDVLVGSAGKVHDGQSGKLLGEVVNADGSPICEYKPCEVHVRGDRVVFGSASCACGDPPGGDMRGMHEVAGLVLWALLLAAGTAASAADWPQFKRDAARTGDAPEEVLAFPMQRIVAVRFPAQIYASPVVVNGRVYIQDALGHVACIDAKSNRVVWLRKTGGINNSSSPAVADGKVFIGSTDGHLYVLNAGDGTVVASIDVPDGVVTAPAVTEAGVYFCSLDGHVNKIDRDGKPVWTWRSGKKPDNEVGRGLVEFAARGDLLALVEGGRLEVVRDRGERYGVVKPGPGGGGDGCATGGVLLGALSGDGEALRACWQTWRTETGGPVAVPILGPKEAAPWKLGGDELMDTRATFSLRGGDTIRGDVCFSSDGRVRWRVDDPDLVMGGFHSSPALAKNAMVIGTENGRAVFAPLHGEQTDSVAFKDRFKAPARKPSCVYRTLGADAASNRAVSSSPAIADGMVFFGGEDGILYGLGAGSEAPIVDAVPKAQASPTTLPGALLKGPEWHTPGGDMGFSFVSPDTMIRPPLHRKWRTRIWSNFKGPMIVAEGKVFAVARLGQIYCLDAETGMILWRRSLVGSESRPGPTYVDGRLLVMRSRRNQGDTVPNDQHGLWCFDAKTGAERWHLDLPLGAHRNSDGVVAHLGKCFLAWKSDKQPGAVTIAAYRIADGREAWRHDLADLYPKNRDTDLRFTSAIGTDTWFLGIPDRSKETYGNWPGLGDTSFAGATLAVDAETGRVRWITREVRPTNWSLIGFRNDTLVVHARKGAQALSPADGKLLWSEPLDQHLKKYNWYSNCYLQHPLSDVFLKSHGRSGVMPNSGNCMSPVFINGAWYRHDCRWNNHVVATAQEADAAGNPVQREIWRHTFAGRACPSPTPAYGRLYYAPNSMGAIFCFQPSPDDAARGK
jgi:outer membrane protein assembly factor BamB